MGRLRLRALGRRVAEPAIRTRRPRSTTTRCSRRRKRTADRRSTIATTRRRTGTATTTPARCSRSSGRFGNNVQAATLMQVLTPEYQRRFAQSLYHVGVSNSAQWVSSTCYPGRHHPLVGPGHSQHPGHGDAAPSATALRHRAQHPSPDPHRPEAREPDLAVVRGDGRLLERRDARRVDGPRARLVDVARVARVQQRARGDRGVHARRANATSISKSPSTTRWRSSLRCASRRSTRSSRGRSPRCATSGRSVSKPSGT